MTLTNDLFEHRRISLRAIDPARNMARHYAIDTSRDLFGAIIVDYRWGRIGTRGQHRQAVFEVEADAEHFIAGLLKRRSRSTRRLGVAYLPYQ
ncbi:WGR domain-containing protein [Novosphingobium terrae]|uniref:WGR domain-containing protein n=1 Tax=Novosphingobium terrae TaxID=2726189 RepID=UPI00197F70F4|nr:WGR domain-containing protein [Novosphingobium terrae]